MNDIYVRLLLGLLFVVGGVVWIVDPPEHIVNPVAVGFAWGLGGFAIYHGILTTRRRG